MFNRLHLYRMFHSISIRITSASVATASYEEKVIDDDDWSQLYGLPPLNSAVSTNLSCRRSANALVCFEEER